MPMKRVTSQGSAGQPMRPGLTPEAREQQLIALAYDAAEQQLLNGTASSQVITHFLKIGAIREQKELEKLEIEKELLMEKKRSLESQQRTEELFQEAIAAMRKYSGNGSDDNA